MSLNVAWPRPDGTLSCSTVDVQGQSSIRVLTDQIKQSLGSEPGSLVAVMQPAELKRLAIVPLKPPMPLSELCSSWEAAQADYETWAKDLAAELDEIVSLDDYDNLLDVHILALLLPLASISFQANTRHEDFQADTLGAPTASSLSLHLLILVAP